MHSTFAPPRIARHARAVAGLEARFLARHALCVSALRLGAARLYESRAPALGATAATACSAGGGVAAAADVRCRAELSCRREVAHSSKAASATAALALSPQQTPLRVSAAAAASPRE
mmetsp:Transcript_38479/g.121232  ORF Transcript_38479/g.121232 Transcript_38479/m.121232 type:complete len:117 (+) Transcript_38479:121-471(+)